MNKFLLGFWVFFSLTLNVFGGLGKYSTNSELGKTPFVEFKDVRTQEKVIVWETVSNDTGDNPHVYLQKGNSAGDLFWKKDIELSARLPGVQTAHQVVFTKDGGIILAWEHRFKNSSETSILLQKINKEGSFIWGEDGILVSTSGGSQISPKLISDGKGGAFVAWNDSRNDLSGENWDVYAQHINEEGKFLWEHHGRAISTDIKDEFVGRIIQTEDGGATIIWNAVVTDYAGVSEGYDFYSKRLTAEEHNQDLALMPFLSLPANDNGYRIAGDILTDGNNGFVMSFINKTPEASNQLFVQHVTQDGTTAFDSMSGLISELSYSKLSDVNLRLDSLSNLSITWLERSGDSTLQRVKTFDHNGFELISESDSTRHTLIAAEVDSLKSDTVEVQTIKLQYAFQEQQSDKIDSLDSIEPDIYESDTDFKKPEVKMQLANDPILTQTIPNPVRQVYVRVNMVEHAPPLDVPFKLRLNPSPQRDLSKVSVLDITRSYELYSVKGAPDLNFKSHYTAGEPLSQIAIGVSNTSPPPPPRLPVRALF